MYYGIRTKGKGGKISGAINLENLHLTQVGRVPVTDIVQNEFQRFLAFNSFKAVQFDFKLGLLIILPID